jgi:hypothetical protein
MTLESGLRSLDRTEQIPSMRTSTVLVGLAASCAASAIAAFLAVGIWLVAVSAPYGFRGFFTADAGLAFIAIGGVAALTTIAGAMSLSILFFLVQRPLLKLLGGSFIRYIIAGIATGASSVAILWSVGFPPDPSDFDLAALIACLAGPAASAAFWVTTRSGSVSSSAHTNAR